LINFSCDTSLKDGLNETIKWFAENYGKLGAIRL
ncbi:MAG: GDP-L-fucose synthase, partial [Chlamydiae bacterium]